MIVISCQPLLLKGLLTLVQAQPSLKVVASSNLAGDAAALVARHAPSVVLLDCEEPERAASTIGSILRVRPETRVVVMDSGGSVDHAVAVLEGGAAGYLSSRSTEDEVLAAIGHVLANATYVSPTLATAVIGAMRAAAQNSDPRAALSLREEQIARHLLLGHTNREIAGCLGLREKTVKHYMTILMQKFDVRNRLELALCLKRPAALGAAGVVADWARRNARAKGPRALHPGQASGNAA